MGLPGETLQENVRIKLDASRSTDNFQLTTNNYLLFCEHPPVYTLGKSGHIENLLISETQLQEKAISFVPTNREGILPFTGRARW